MNAAEEIDYDLLAKKIAKEMSIAPPPHAVVWDNKQCADYFNYSLVHFSERIASKPDFPKPFNFSGKSKGKKLWYAREVMTWLENQKT